MPSQLLAPTVQSSRAEVWDLKEITFRHGSRRIITQNSNGLVACHYFMWKVVLNDVAHARSLLFVGSSRAPSLLYLKMTGMAGNILILRGQIEILPPNREKVSYEYLSQLLGEDLLSVSGDVDISAALSAMPSTQSVFTLTMNIISRLSKVRGDGP